MSTQAESHGHDAAVAEGARKRLFGLLAEFDNPHDVMVAAEKVRAEGYRNWDVHTPFPVHGMDDAMGIPLTKLPLVIFAGGATGTLTGLVMQWWMNAVDYKWLVSGKPFWSVPANIPIVFEVTVLFSALTAFFGMFIWNGLPLLYHALFNSKRFARATDDKFFISIEATDPRFHRDGTRAFLEGLGGDVEEVEETEE